jgi:molybdate transport system substrate-binding protein
MRAVIEILIAGFFLVGLCMVPSVGLAGNQTGISLSVSAGVGLKDALFAIQKAYARNQPSVNLEFNFAASGFLRKQIEQGAPVDLFLAPGRQHFQALLEEGYTDAAHSCALLGNRLALIVSREKRHVIESFADLVDHADTITIGMPDMVPVGTYARQTLKHLGIWSRLEKRLVYGKSVRQVLAYVDSGNADAGVVFASDASLLASAVVVAMAPADSHKPIVFSMAGMSDSPHPAVLEEFMAFLTGEEAAAIFSRCGFTPLVREEKQHEIAGR